MLQTTNIDIVIYNRIVTEYTGTGTNSMKIYSSNLVEMVMSRPWVATGPLTVVLHVSNGPCNSILPVGRYEPRTLTLKYLRYGFHLILLVMV